MYKIFKDKNVAFVAYSPIIEGKSLGEEIDGFDVVYKTNFLVKNTTDYGSRCDVMSVLPDQLKFLSTHTAPNLVLFEVEGIQIETDIASIYIVSIEERKEIVNWCLREFGLDIIDATSGLVAYYLAMKYGAKSFKFYGITGYQDQSGNVVNHGVVDHYTREAFDILGNEAFSKTVDMKNYDCHNFKNQNTVFRILLKAGLIQMDPYSEQYFKPKT